MNSKILLSCLTGAAVLAAVFSSPAWAETTALKIQDAYAYASAPMQKNGAAFLTIVNEGEADRVLSAQSPASERVELHTHLMENGTMMMRQVDALDVPAGGQLALKPAGDHIMLMGLKEQLNAGSTLELTLTFEKAGTQNITVPVVSPGSQNAESHDAHSHGAAHE